MLGPNPQRWPKTKERTKLAQLGSCFWLPAGMKKLQNSSHFRLRIHDTQTYMWIDSDQIKLSGVSVDLRT